MSVKPQLEHGYIRIANELWDALTRVYLSSALQRCLFCIIRETYGYNRKKTKISIERFEERTRLAKGTIYRALSDLKDRKIVIHHPEKTGDVMYQFNKEYTSWKSVTKRRIVTNLRKQRDHPENTQSIKDTSLKTKSTKVSSSKKKEPKKITTEIIEYLNLKCKRKFKPTSEATQKLVNARVREGYTLEDFKLVIDIKCDEWFGDEKMDQYLRPSTLFRGTNFENYLNQRNLENPYDIPPHLR